MSCCCSKPLYKNMQNLNFICLDHQAQTESEQLNLQFRLETFNLFSINH